MRLEAIGLDSEELKKTGRLGSQENTRCIGDYLIKEGYTEVDTIRLAKIGKICFIYNSLPFFMITLVAMHLSLQELHYQMSK